MTMTLPPAKHQKQLPVPVPQYGPSGVHTVVPVVLPATNPGGAWGLLRRVGAAVVFAVEGEQHRAVGRGPHRGPRVHRGEGDADVRPLVALISW